MLSNYQIPNAGLQLNDKEEIISLQTPFIAQASNDFVLVTKLYGDSIEYIWRAKKLNTTISEFKTIWTGVVLLAEPDEDSKEPEYSKHIVKERFVITEKIIIAVFILTLSCAAFVHFSNVHLLARLVFVPIIGVGIYVSYLLLLKQMKIGSQSADKICSLFKKSDCNDVLETVAAKAFGIVGWSEVGFAYFIANMLIVVFMPDLLVYAAIINLIALPYTIWSVWYQKFRAKQWCPLCLIVQAILWLSFIAFCGFGIIAMPLWNFYDIVIAASFYVIPLLAVNLLLPKLSEALKVEKLTQEFASLRLKDEVFLTYLKLQPRYDVDKNTSRIIFGNPNAELLVTILTNPHCNPCARMHKRIEALLNDFGEKMCIQYVFSSFNEEMESSGQFLTAIYLNHIDDMKFVKYCYNDWFLDGKNNRDEFFIKYKEDADGEVVRNEYNKHIHWREQTKIRATPTILVNGYELPDNYVVEDLKYFVNI